MVMVHNRSRGVRVLQVRDGDATGTVALNPGEARELDLVNEDDRVVQGMIKSGDLSLGKSKVAEVDDAERYRNDPMQVGNLAAANAAGASLAEPVGADAARVEEATRTRQAAAMAAAQTKPAANPAPITSNALPPAAGTPTPTAPWKK